MSNGKQINVRKIVAYVVIGLMVLAGLVICLVLWRGSTKDIEAVADSFKPLDGWQQTKYEVIPPQFLCLMGNCPEVYKVWVYKDFINYDDIKKFTNDDKLLEIEDRCKDKNLDVCEFNGKRNGYQYRIHVERRDEMTNIGLIVRERGLVDNID